MRARDTTLLRRRLTTHDLDGCQHTPTHSAAVNAQRPRGNRPDTPTQAPPSRLAPLPIVLVFHDNTASAVRLDA